MTKTLIAKPVVQNQFWIVTDGKEKVGNVIADGSTISWNKVSQSSTIRFSNITGGSIIFNNIRFKVII